MMSSGKALIGPSEAVEDGEEPAVTGAIADKGRRVALHNSGGGKLVSHQC